MSAWIIALGLSVGYLISKNVSVRQQLEESVAKFNSAAKPATGGVTSAEVRDAYKSKAFVKYGDMNTDIPTSQMKPLDEGAQKTADEVSAFDGGSQQIQGVLLHFDGLGI